MLPAGREPIVTTVVVDDPELAVLFERIARAIPAAVTTGAGLAPLDLLRLYARLLEEGASVTLMTMHPPTRDPEA